MKSVVNQTTARGHEKENNKQRFCHSLPGNVTVEGAQDWKMSKA